MRHRVTVGIPLMLDNGALRRETRTERIRRWFRRVLWWRQSRFETAAVDGAAGTVTVVGLRWSWRHWRWVREDYVFTGGGPDECVEGMEEWTSLKEDE